MPLYFFDIDDGEGLALDGDGDECAGPREARDQAVRALLDIAKESDPAADRCELTVKVRDEDGAYLCSVNLSLVADWLPVARQSQTSLEA